MNEINTVHLVISGIAGGIIWNVLTALLSGYFRSKWGVNFDSKLTSPEIECKRLTVVDRNGKARVILASDAPFISDVTPYPSWIECEGVTIYGSENCGRVIVKSKSENSENKCNSASLFASERGGSVSVYDKYDTNGGNSEGAVEIIIDEHGGYVEASSGKGGRCAVGINEYGNGTVSTWDKNGYRQ